jgi:competence protein ComEC
MKASQLLKQTHIYYFTIAGCVGLFTGIILALRLPDNVFADDFWLFLSCVLILLSLVKYRKIFLVTIFIAGLFLGIWRMSNYEIDKSNFVNLVGQKVQITGVVSDDINYGPGSDMRFKLNQIKIMNRALAGEVWISSREDVVLKRSDIVTMVGTLNNGFGGFSASMVNGDITDVSKSSKNDLGLVVRDKFAENTDHIDQPGRALGLGFLAGQKNDLPEDLQKNVKNLGLSHMIVASGYNLTILVIFARKLLVRLSKYLSTILAGTMIAGFMMITGYSPSMSRAGLVAGLSLLAWYYGRKMNPVVLLLISASITLIIKPSYIWGDLGWYLSFFAFIGVLILGPLVSRYFWGQAKPNFWRDLIITTACAQIMTLPILIYSFGLFSAWSLIANILILPVVPYAMLAVFIAGMAGILISPMAGIMAVPANILLKYCLLVIDKIASLPSAVSEISINVGQMVLGYILIIGVIIWLKLKTKHSFISDKSIID